MDPGITDLQQLSRDLDVPLEHFCHLITQQFEDLSLDYVCSVDSLTAIFVLDSQIFINF